jgi:hypothetical protein
MRNNNIGIYVGFSVMAIQTIAGDYYRDYRQVQHNNKINRILFLSGSATTTRATASTKAQQSSKY